MENKILIDLSVKYGLSTEEMTKLTNTMYQVGIYDANSKQFAQVAEYICENKLINTPAEELIEELKLKGFVV